jgi:hypothetical protein
MHLPVHKAGLIGLSALCALVAAIAVFVYSSGDQEAEAATYVPELTDVRYCNAMTTTFPDYILSPIPGLAGNPSCVDTPIPASTAGVDTTVFFEVDAGHSNFGSSVVTNAPGTVATDADIADGQIVGALGSTVNLSILSGPCNQGLSPEFVLFDSDTSSTVLPPGTLPGQVQPEGTSDRFETLAFDDGSGSGYDFAADEAADSDSPFVATNLPFYVDLFTPENGSYIAPSARYTGMTRVPQGGGDFQLLSFFQFAPGSLDDFATDADDEPHIFGRVGKVQTPPATGSLSLSILNDPTALAISVSPIHDFCTELKTKTMLLGESYPAGTTRFTTPAAGTYGISSFSYGQRDADNDGRENAYDTCPFAAGFTDTDGDGIHDVCDPTGVNTNLGDHDDDDFFNNQDNCPLLDNGPGAAPPNNVQVDSEVDASYIVAAPDGGPISDSIGDQCDPAPGTSTGQGGFAQAYLMVPVCIGAGPDADGDGFCAAQDVDDADTDPGAPGLADDGFVLNEGMDVDYNPTHGDKFGGNHELYHGTNPYDNCGFTAGAPTQSETWPADLVESNSITIQDVLAIKPVFNQNVPAVSGRYDFVRSKSITIQDVLFLKPLFNQTCTP